MKRPGRRGNRGREDSPGCEWVGGRVLSPFYVTEDDPFRPEMILWLEMPEELVLYGDMIDPEGPAVSLADALVKATESPMVGPPRRPARIRVADRRLAAEVEGAARGIEIVVAPTPEIDRVLRHMAESLPAEEGEDLSYFEGGRVSPKSVEGLFRAAEVLFPVAPWKVADDIQVLRLDIPRFGVEGACVSVIGALGESVGFLIFPSLVAHERFLEAAESFEASRGSVDMGTPILSLNFERGADLPDGMRREVARHGWPVAGPDAYPWVQNRDRDGVLRPLKERDVRIVSACATSLAAFFVKHPRLFESDDFEPVCESWLDRDGLEVRFTVPYEAGPLFEVNAPDGLGPPSGKGQSKVGRNAPCPCGSGKKYKKCCLGKEEEAREDARAPVYVHGIDERLVSEMFRFAARRFGEPFLRAEKDFHDPEQAVELFLPWSVYHFLVEGKPVVRWFLEERRPRLSDTESEWLEAQEASWLSIWEVGSADPQRGRISLKDVLSGEERDVREVNASRTLTRRDVVLGRVVDSEGISVLCGLYPRALPPMEAAEVVRRVRGRLRRKRMVPVERLRDEKIGRYMIRRWEEALEELLVRRSVPPKLQNTDGEELLLTVDHFEFDPAARTEIRTCLASVEGVEPPERDDSAGIYTFARPGNRKSAGLDNTIIGTARLSEGRLRLETNSVRRADRLRARVEEACGELVRHSMREHSDPSALLKQGEAPLPRGEQPSLIPPEEAGRVVREFKERHYAGWLDLPLPALSGLTPREAVRTRVGRGRVDVLLKDMENHESRMPEEESFSFSGMRKELGLDP